MEDRLAKAKFPTDVEFLIYRPVPDVKLTTAEGEEINLARTGEISVVFIHPGSSAAITPDAGWVDRLKAIPCAAGCTGQSKGFQSRERDFTALGAQIIGLSGQTTEELRAVKEKLGFTIQFVSDSRCEFLNGLGMRQIPIPAPNGDGTKMVHPRLILVLRGGRITDAMVPEPTPEGVANSANVIYQKLLAKTD